MPLSQTIRGKFAYIFGINGEIDGCRAVSSLLSAEAEVQEVRLRATPYVEPTISLQNKDHHSDQSVLSE